MDKKIIIAGIIVAIILCAIYLITIPEHRIVVNYIDGQSKPLGISYKNKNVESLTYEVIKDYNLIGYRPYFLTPLGEYELQPNTEGKWTIPIYLLVNYSLGDGTYDITLIPRGIVTENNKPVLLSSIQFSITIVDDRVINIIFG